MVLPDWETFWGESEKVTWAPGHVIWKVREQERRRGEEERERRRGEERRRGGEEERRQGRKGRRGWRRVSLVTEHFQEGERKDAYFLQIDEGEVLMSVSGKVQIFVNILWKSLSPCVLPYP
jgi:hypothetical protein